MIDPRVLRDDPDRVRAAQAKRGLSDDVVDRALAADTARRQAIADFEAKRAEQKQLGKQIPQAQGDEKQALLARTKTLAAEVKAAEAAQARGRGGVARGADVDPQPRRRRGPGRAARTTSSCSRPSARRASSTSSRATTSSSAGCSARSTSSAAPRCRARASTSSPASAPSSSSRWSTWRWTRPASAGFTQVIAPSLVKPRAMEGTGFLGQAADDVYRIEGQDLYLVGTSEVPMAAYHSDEILDGATLPLRYAAFSPCFRKEAGSHGKDTKGIIRVHWFDKVEMFVYTTLEESVRRAPAAAGVGEGVPRQARARLPGDRHRRRRPRPLARSASSTARRGSPRRASTASSPRPPTAPTSRPAASTSAAGSPRTGSTEPVATLNGTLVRDHAHHRGDPRDPPAGRRLGAGARGAAARTSAASRS